MTTGKAIFIGGCPRSGTTMLGSMLGVPPECVATPESHFKQTIPVDLRVDWKMGIPSKALQLKLENSFRFRIWEISFPSVSLPERMNLEEYRHFLLKLVDDYAHKHGRPQWKIWVDHTPQNFQEAHTLSNIFPDARFVHLIRDPRAVYASILKVDWGPVDVVDFVDWWAKKISYPCAFQAVRPDRVTMVRYEDIIVNPGRELQRICEFTGIEFQMEMLDGKGFKLPTYTLQQHRSVGNKPKKENLNRWKVELDNHDIFYIERHLGDLMALFGYEKMNPELESRSLPQKIRNRMSRIFFEWKRGKNFEKRKKKLIES